VNKNIEHATTVGLPLKYAVFKLNFDFHVVVIFSR